jgi:undecaprenyl-diphosphatase
MVTLFQSFILGLLQGLTEFLPVSSTAHLRVVPALLGWGDPGAALSAVIHLGTLAAVVVYFWRQLIEVAGAFVLFLAGRKPYTDKQVRLAWILVVGTIPVGVFGVIFQHQIETSLRSLWVVTGALVVFALVLAVAEWVGRRQKTIEKLSLSNGLFIGMAQALALVPGASRSGVTLSAGLLIGLNRPDAARVSFLLSVPAIAASGLFEFIGFIKHGVGESNLAELFVGTLTAGVSGYLAIGFLMRLLQKHSTFGFIVYRILLGTLLTGLLLDGYLTAY